MTQNEKDLLLKDFCSRLHYGVKVNNEIQGDFNIYGICENIVFGRNEVCHIDFDVEKIKPYLFPLSSMTEERKDTIDLIASNSNTPLSDVVDFYNKNHLDYRGLIPMGLAIDATNKNIYQ